jgi:hypothetical protein
MNFLDVRAGDEIEVGTQVAYRFWRYVFPPFETNIRLLSWVSGKRWYPGQFVEGTSPDVGEQGIHGYKTMDDLMWSVRGKPEGLVVRSQMTQCDGIVIGTVALWGVVWDHAKGYRAQFARPTSFISSYGKRSQKALAELRSNFLN